MFVVGPKDEGSKTVSVRDRIDGDLGALEMARAIAKLESEVKNRVVRQVFSGQSASLAEKGPANQY